MQVIFDKERDRFEAISSFAEKDIIVQAGGWRWDQTVKRWWTKKTDAAAKLGGYADEAARLILGEAIEKANIEAKQQAELAVKSRAVDAEIKIPCPDGLAFLGYQKAGVAFAIDRDGTLIADEMGLGKTIQAIGISNADVSIRSVLIVCPASLKLNWLREWRKWDVKELLCGIANGSLPYSDVVILNYELLKKYADRIRERSWDLVIFDECHYLKNPKAQRTQYALGYKKKGKEEILPIIARRRVMLTGTPIVNRPIELWPLIHSLDPRGLGQNFMAFAKRYCNAFQDRYGWNFTGASNLDELQEKLRGRIMVRRLKKDVLKELPPKRRQVIQVPPEGCEDIVAEEIAAMERAEERLMEHRVAVEIAKASDDPADYEEAVKKLRAAQGVMFEEMSAVRKAVALAKIPFLAEHLREVIEANGKVVCMVHHHEVVDRLKAEFGGLAVVLDGRMEISERQKSVDRFQEDDSCNLFIGSIKAAGVGITLTASSTVVFGELDWVPGNITQAEDRCHRIGQTDSVLVQHLVLDGSLDSRMVKTLISKQEVIDKALDRETQLKQQILEMPEVVEQQTATEDRTPATHATTPQTIEKEAIGISPSQVEAIHQCLKMLAGVCDGAQQLDGQGFNRFDARIGHDLAERWKLTAKQAVIGVKIVRKYRRQLPAEVLLAALGQEVAA